MDSLYGTKLSSFTRRASEEQSEALHNMYEISMHFEWIMR
jgi:hypothetical protein